MQLYKLHFLDRNDVVITVRAFAGHDDLAAWSEGQKLSATHAIEIWNEDRKVGRVPKQASAKTRARISL